MHVYDVNCYYNSKGKARDSCCGVPLLFVALGCQHRIDIPLLKELIRNGSHLDIASPHDCDIDYFRGMRMVWLRQGTAPLAYAFDEPQIKLLLIHGATINTSTDKCITSRIERIKSEWLQEWFLLMKPLFLAKANASSSLACLPQDLLHSLICLRIDLQRKQTLCQEEVGGIG
jgi:hypothetical protein